MLRCWINVFISLKSLADFEHAESEHEENVTVIMGNYAPESETGWFTITMLSTLVTQDLSIMCVFCLKQKEIHKSKMDCCCTWACRRGVHRARFTASSSALRVTAHASTLTAGPPDPERTLDPQSYRTRCNIQKLLSEYTSSALMYTVCLSILWFYYITWYIHDWFMKKKITLIWHSHF